MIICQGGLLPMKRLSFLNINLLLLLLVCTVPLAAAEQVDEEIVVTATKIPQPITEVPGLVQTIDEETNAEDQNKSVGELLLQEGLTVSTHGGGASFANIQLGGASAAQTLVMFDGIPLSGGTTGIVDLSNIPVSGVEKIEVVYGPLSALYGANALGGVVNIIPNLTGDAEQRFYLSGGTFGSARGSLQLTRERWGLAIGAARTDGHRPHSATERYDLAAQLNLVQHENDFLKLYGGYRVKNAQLPGSELWPSKDHQEDRNLFLNLAGKKEFSNNSLEAKLSYQSWDNYHESIFNKDRHFSTRWGSDLTFRHDRDAHRFLAGLAFNYDTSDSTASGKHWQHGIGLYLQDLWDLNDQLLLHAGLRWDQIAEYKPVFSPRVGLTWFPAERLNFGLSYGTAFRVPTVNDLYWEGSGNPDLKPEYGQKWEVSAHWQERQITVKANAYQSLLRDGIIWADPDGDDQWLPENVDRLRIYGFNLIATYDWGLIDTSLGYAFLDRRGWDSLRAGYTRDLNYFGQHQFNLKGQADFGKLNINTGCQVVANRIGTANGEKMPDYLLLSAGLRYQLTTNYVLSFDVENLTDTKYQIQEGYPMPGRNFKLTLNGRY